jgi:hypothetical protein
MALQQHKHMPLLTSMDGLQEAKAPQTFSGKIIKRFLDEEDFNKFMNRYRTHRKSTGGNMRDRAQALEVPLAKEDHLLLHAYMTETDTTVADIGRNMGIDPKKAYNRVIRVALRYLYQNKENFMS